jgi:hypothetical protein
MIDGVIEAVRTRVLVPQASVPAAAYRVYEDRQRGGIKAQRNTAELVPLTTTPMNPQIGSGFGGVAGGTATLRHILALVLTVTGADRKTPALLRGELTTQFVARALGVDWVNVPIGGGQAIDKLGLTIEYADLESDTLAAYATLVFTFDTEWTV